MNEKLYQAIGDINEKHIREAEQGQPERKSKPVFKDTRIWKVCAVAAACLALFVALGSLENTAPEQAKTTVIGGVARDYKGNVFNQEISIIWPREYEMLYETYSSMIFEGKEYRTRANAIDEELLGEVLGNCTAKNYDIYSDTTCTAEFEVRRVCNVSPELLVAVGMEDRFYVYMRDEYAPQQTLGQMMDMAGLPQTLELNRYSVNEGHTTKGYYTIEDDSNIWQILTDCADAPVVGEIESDNWDWGMGERNYICFTATSEALGIYKKVLYITEDGYLKTNIFEYGYLYEIGTEAADQIISHVRAHSTETVFEPYEYKIAGTVTMIGDDYVLVDDTVVCRDPEDGMVFKVPTDDIRVRRCVEFGGVGVGDIVMVSFRGDIDVEAGNVIRGAVSIDQGFLEDGYVAVPE